MVSTMFKKILQKLTQKKLEKNYPNRFLKFYYLNQEKLNQERRHSYAERKQAGICIRCQKKALPGIVFCEYHQQKQRGYNRRARQNTPF